MDPRLSPCVGKRTTGGRGNGHPPALPVRFTPRPHVTARIHHRTFDALIDTGSEISFVNQHTAHAVDTLNFPLQPEKGIVQLANGQTVTLPGRVHLPLVLAGRHIWHSFHVMPTLGSTILLGIDFWAKVGHTLPAPHLAPNPATPATAVAEGLTRHTADTDYQLREFLAKELPLFNDITSPTDRTWHEIRLKPGVLPI